MVLTASSCQSVTLEWDSVAGARTYLIGYTESLASDAAATPAVLLSTASKSMEVTGLRAATRYAFRVAARSSDGRQSTWATASSTTEPPTLPPESPGAPKGTSGSECGQLSLRLPEPTGCRAPEEFSLQYLPDPTGQWLDHEQHIRAPTVSVNGLRRGGTYEFRLIASNEVGSSLPGASSGPLASCPGKPSRAEEAGSEDRLPPWKANAVASSLVPSSVMGAALLTTVFVLVGGLFCWLRVRCARRDPRGRYVRAEISAEQWTVSGDEPESVEADLPSLRVLFQTPGSTTSLQADVSTQGLTSVSATRRQLASVFKELHGQSVPADALVVQYEDVHGDLVHFHSASSVKDLLAARRVVVSGRPLHDVGKTARVMSYAF